MFKRLLYIAISFLLDCWLIGTACHHIPEWFTAPGRLTEALLLLSELLLIIGLPTLQILLWRKLKLHLPDEPERRWDSKQVTYHLPGQEQPTPSQPLAENYNFLIYLLLMGVALSVINHTVKDIDDNFRRAVEREYYLTADIYYHLLKADPDDARALYVTIINSGEPDVKKRQVEYLLQKGANPMHFSSISSADMRTPVSAATRNPDRHLLPLLLEHCHNIQSVDASLEYPVRDGDTDTVRLLLRHGAEVNFPDVNGMTALHWAASPLHGDERKALEMAQILLEAGAHVNAVHLTRYPPFARTALDMVEGCEPFPAMAELLRRYGAKRAGELTAEYYSTQQSQSENNTPTPR